MEAAFARATAVFGTWDDWDDWRSKLSRSLSSLSELRSRTGRLEPASPFKGAQGVMVKPGLFSTSDEGSRDLDATGKWGARYVTWVKLTHISTGKAFWHFNTHWCVHSEGSRICNEEVRYRGAKNMVSAIQEHAKEEPVVITGDFNAALGEKGPQHFLKSGFKLAERSWVDMIFYSHHWQLLSHGVGKEAGSDHKPVFAELALCDSIPEWLRFAQTTPGQGLLFSRQFNGALVFCLLRRDNFCHPGLKCGLTCGVGASSNQDASGEESYHPAHLQSQAMRAMRASFLLAALASAQEVCRDGTCKKPNSGNTLLQFGARTAHLAVAVRESCAAFGEWPQLDGVSCGGCQALVETATYNRCDEYCESFGHRCVAAAEELDETCQVKETFGCDEAILGTSDMLCTCERQACYAGLGGVAEEEGEELGALAEASAGKCKKACDDEEECESFTYCPSWKKCFLKDKSLTSATPIKINKDCKSFYKAKCEDVPTTGTKEGFVLKLVSYNLYWWNAFDQKSWKSDGVIKNIRNTLRPDSIGLQECDEPGQIARRTGTLERASEFQGAQGVMVKKGIFTKSQSGSRDLQATGKWGPRYTTWVKLTDKASGKSFWHFNTHWCVHSQGNRICNEEVRYGGAKNMLATIQEIAKDDPVVITGDFNAERNEKGPNHFLDNGFKLAVNSWVDFIFYSPHWELLSQGKGSMAGSDHHPVFAELRLK
ncbi:unnamed protein product [Effrenium voratum]|nr:unnamed protein product [Effrenium voratum]